MAQALKLVPSSAVRAEDIDTERVDPDLLGVDSPLLVALDAQPSIHDDLRRSEGQEMNDRTNTVKSKPALDNSRRIRWGRGDYERLFDALLRAQIHSWKGEHMECAQRMLGCYPHPIAPLELSAKAELSPRVIDTLMQAAGVSTYHPDGDQLDKLHAFARNVATEALARYAAPPPPAPASAPVGLTAEQREAVDFAVKWFDQSVLPDTPYAGYSKVLRALLEGAKQ